jgi:hypothetical protein
MTLPKFRKERLQPALLGRVEAAVAALSREHGQKYFLAQAFWGRHIIAKSNDIVLAAAGTDARPPDVTIVAVEGDRILLPSVREADFKYLCGQLGLTSEEDIMKFAKFVYPDDEIR